MKFFAAALPALLALSAFAAERPLLTESREIVDRTETVKGRTKVDFLGSERPLFLSAKDPNARRFSEILESSRKEGKRIRVRFDLTTGTIVEVSKIQ
ncbi:MAG: hypothetical protein JST04_05830 [Bdellovibrionales bacterium]|nr:hypothetical protein [Bdellovibrionales bacterium]